jgi:hypothetical protein
VHHEEEHSDVPTGRKMAMTSSLVATRLVRWRRGLTDLLHPGPVPLRTACLTVVLVLITLAVIDVLLVLGIHTYGRAARYFGEGRAGTYYSGLQLVACAAAAGLLARKAGPPPFRRFWWTVAVGMMFLAADEFYGIHEELDRGIHKLMGWRDTKHWLTDHLDDAIEALYGIVALVWADRHFEKVLMLRWPALILGAGFIGFVLMLVLDLSGRFAAVEDSIKLVAETLILSALISARWDPRFPAR